MSAATFPAGARAVTPRWLTEVLRDAGSLPHGRVLRVTATLLGAQGAMSETHRLAITYDDDDAGPDAPAGLILKLAPADAATRAHTQRVGAFEREQFFYRTLAARAELRTPRCYFAQREPETGAFALLLDEVAGEPGIPTLSALEQTLCELAKLHARFWNAPELAELGMLEYGAEVEHALGQQLCAAPERIAARTGFRLPAEFGAAVALGGIHFEELCRLERARPRTVVHGDLHPGQIVTSAAGPVVFDWQTLAIGSAGRDVARLIAMTLPPMARARHEYQMLGVYQAALERHGVRGYSLRECYADYQRGLVTSALINASAIAQLDVNRLFAPRSPGEQPLLLMLVGYIDDALRGNSALALLRGELTTLAAAA